MVKNTKEKDIDQLSGIATTGHDWDGIKELDTPSPRWWLWVFYLTCVFAVVYWILYPAWPTISGKGHRGGTVGAYQTNQYKQLHTTQAQSEKLKEKYLARLRSGTFEQILSDPELYEFAIAGGASTFKDNCATCHGIGGAGSKGYPNLNDDDWLWGGSIDQIYYTIKHGIRSTSDDTRTSQMPAFSGMLTNEQIEQVATYVQSLSKGGEINEAGKLIFEEQCAACHMPDGHGNQEFGAPNLSDAIWFYSKGEKSEIIKQIKHPKHGVMPTWNGRLSDDTIKQLALYVYSLGGGK